MKILRLQHVEMSRVFLCRLILVFLFACIATATAQAQTEDRNTLKRLGFESQLEELLTTVYCYCGCERETIEKCVCGTAQMIETDFRDRLNAGETVAQIRTNYLETRGPQFYAVMPAKGINLIAYIMPVVILLLIGGVVFTVLRKSRQQAAEATAGYGKPAPLVSDEAVKKVEAELEKYKQEK